MKLGFRDIWHVHFYTLCNEIRIWGYGMLIFFYTPCNEIRIWGYGMLVFMPPVNKPGFRDMEC